MKNLVIFCSAVFFLGCVAEKSEVKTLDLTPTPTVSPSNAVPAKSLEMPKNAARIEPEKNIVVSDDEKVSAEIKAKAKKDFPDDYVMQKFAYDEQLKAYKYMKTVPTSSIKSKAENDFPDDFVMQKFSYEEQTKAKKEMEKY